MEIRRGGCEVKFKKASISDLTALNRNAGAVVVSAILLCWGR